MSAIDDRPFPKAALFAAGLLIAASVAMVGTARLLEARHPNPAPDVLQTAGIDPVAETVLRFEPLQSGSIRVSRAEGDSQPMSAPRSGGTGNGGSGSGEIVRVITPNEAGFIHGAMRGMRRARAQAGLDPAPVLTITRWSNGRVTVVDAATNFNLELDAFGATNKAAFAALLEPSGVSPEGAAP